MNKLAAMTAIGYYLLSLVAGITAIWGFLIGQGEQASSTATFCFLFLILANLAEKDCRP